MGISSACEERSTDRKKRTLYPALLLLITLSDTYKAILSSLFNSAFILINVQEDTVCIC